MLNNDIKPLRENEIAGAETINPIVKFVLGMKSQTEWMTINPDGKGSVNFDIDAAGLFNAALAMAHGMLDFAFKCDIRNGVLSVVAGKVYLPGHSVGISSYTHDLTLSDAGKMVYVRMESASSGTLVFDEPVTHTVQTGSTPYRVTLPVATVARRLGNWAVTYHHLGDFVLAHTPYVYIPGYSRGKTQGLMHMEDEDGAKWVDAGPCGEEE